MSCPGNCIFCDQTRITGFSNIPDSELIKKIVYRSIEKADKARPGINKYEVAFYGGSFSLAPKSLQLQWLAAARVNEFITFRISTRPDAVKKEWFERLKQEGLETVEIGVQSLTDTVLKQVCRNHTALDSIRAVETVKDIGLKSGMQLMTGLPGQNRDSILNTLEQVIYLKPDFVRIYPALVFENTPMAQMYLNKEYKPFNLDETIKILSIMIIKLFNAKIKLIRVGLHGDKNFFSNNILAGPIEQGLKQRALNFIFKKIFFNYIEMNKNRIEKMNLCNKISIKINPLKIDIITAHNGLKDLNASYSNFIINVVPDNKIEEYQFEIEDSAGFLNKFSLMDPANEKLLC
jgi:histone acetyltransferase (RNA polymerase elongator complex component)